MVKAYGLQTIGEHFNMIWSNPKWVEKYKSNPVDWGGGRAVNAGITTGYTTIVDPVT